MSGMPSQMPSQMQDDNVQTKVSIWSLTKRLWPYFMRQKRLFYTTIASVVVLSVGGRISIWLFGTAVDGLTRHDEHAVLKIATAYLVMEVLQNFANFSHMYYFSKLGNRILFQLRSELVTHVQKLPIPFFDRNPSGRITTRLTNDVVALGELFSQGIIMVFSSAFSLLATLIAMFLISPRITIAVGLVAPPIIVVAFYLSNANLKTLRESKKIMARINAFVAENVSGMRVLQLYQRIDRNRSRFAGLSAEYRVIQLRSVLLNALLWPTMSLFNAVTTAVALYMGGVATRNGEITTGAMIAMLIHVRFFVDPLRTILEKYQNLQNSVAGAERMFTLLGEPLESDAGTTLPAGRLRGQIEFRDLNFRYAPTLPSVLKNINLLVKPGQSVALVGRTGSGKSTIISLLQRFYDQAEGEILLDGISYKQIARPDLRRRIGVVQQDTFMFRGTIADNIGLGDPSISRECIEQAAVRASCSDILRRHTGGLDARVEERGANLSFGERQLIAFARVLAFDPDILILDEATANIDSQSESAIQRATHEVTRDRTSIIIAHRISTVLECNLIVVLDKGQIIEMGTHQELIALKGAYFTLSRSQFQENNDNLEA